MNTIKIKQGYAQSGDLEEGSLTFTFSEDSGNQKKLDYVIMAKTPPLHLTKHYHLKTPFTPKAD